MKLPTSLPRSPGTDRLVVFKWFLLEPLGAICLSFLQNSFFYLFYILESTYRFT